MTVSEKCSTSWNGPGSRRNHTNVKPGSARDGGVPCPAMAEAHLSPQAYERLREELAWRSGEHRREISLTIETRPRARRHQRERRLRRGQERARHERSAHPPARADAEDRGRHRGRVERRSRRAGLPRRAALRRRRRRRRPISSVRSRSATRSTTSCRRTHRSVKHSSAPRPGATVTYQGPKRELRSPSSASVPSTDYAKRSVSTDPPLHGGSTRCRRSIARNSSCNSGGSDSKGDICEWSGADRGPANPDVLAHVDDRRDIGVGRSEIAHLGVVGVHVERARCVRPSESCSNARHIR